MLDFIIQYQNKSMSLNNLFLGAASIIVIYLISNLILEHIYSTEYVSLNGESHQFIYPSMLVYVQSLFCAIFGFIKGKFIKQKTNPVPHKTQALLGFFYSIHIVAVNFALLFIPYPSQVIGMNCRYLVVVLVGVYFSRVKCSKQKLSNNKIFTAIIATIGAISYNILKEESKISESHLNPSTYWIGYALVAAAVFSDAFFLDNQAYVKEKYHPTSNHLLTSANFYTFLFCVLLSIFKGTFISQIEFCFQHPSINRDILILSILQAAGQVVIYFVIVSFKQHVFPLIAMTRKILTLIFSIVIFKHQVNIYQIASLIIVFGGIFYEILDEFILGKRNPLNMKEALDLSSEQKKQK